MSKRLTALAVLALVVGACGGGAAATNAPTAAPGAPVATAAAATPEATAGSEATAGAEATTSGGGGGTSEDALKALAQKLTPPGATETGHLASTGVYQLYFTTSMSIDQLTAFYDEKANSLPIKEYSKLTASGGLYIGGADPVLAIVAAPDPQNAGSLSVIISVGS